MPQDNPRTAIYRSLKRNFLVPYEDSNETDQCRTDRKSKNASRMVSPTAIRRQLGHKRPHSPFTSKEEKKAMAMPSIQLSQVSQGADKLNMLIDSWFKGAGSDGQSRDIARDLLSGALDLQESLVMLGELQEASKVKAQSKRKHKLKVEDSAAGKLGIGVTGLNRFGNKNYKQQWEKPRNSFDGSLRNCLLSRNSVGGSSTDVILPRNSVDGSSRTCVEELKQMVKDSLCRQSLLDEETLFSGWQQSDLLSDGPSAGSSRSSTLPNGGIKILHGDLKARSDSSVSSSSQQKEAKRPNLIAKLMGLEDLPPETVQSNTKQAENMKPLHSHQHIFNINMPKSRNLQLKEKNADPECKTLKEIIDAMQFKGLLKTNHVKDFELRSHLLGTSSGLTKHNRKDSRAQSSDDELPPIVIIKPLHAPCIDDGISESKHSFKRCQDRELKIMETADESFNKIDPIALSYKQNKMEAMKSSKKEMQNKLSDRREPMKEANKTVSEENQKKIKSADGFPTKFKKAITADIPSTETDPSPMNNKQTKKEQIKVRKEEMQTMLPEGRKLMKEADEALDDVSQKDTKTSISLNRQEMETTKMPKKSELKSELMLMALQKQHRPVKENKKSTVESRPKAKTIPENLSNPQNRSTAVKNNTAGQKCFSQNCDLKCSAKPLQQNSNLMMKRSKKVAKPTKETTSMNSVTEKEQCKEDEKKTDANYEIHFDSSTTSKFPAAEYPVLMENRHSEIQIQDNTGSNNEILPMPTDERSFESSKEDNHIAGIKNAVNKINRDDLKQLILSSPSLLNSAEELFNPPINQNMIFPTDCVPKVGIKDARLQLDCANELIMHKSARLANVSHPMIWAHRKGLKDAISLDQLVDELTDGIESFENYAKVTEGAASTDGLYVMLGRDLKCRGMERTGIWDLGWSNGFSIEEADQAVGDVQKYIVDMLIGEIVIELQ